MADGNQEESALKRELNKAKTSFNNLKPGAKAGIVAGVVGLALVGAGSSQNPTTAVNPVPATPVVSEEEVIDALDKCTLLKASEAYKANSKAAETELFQTAETACEAKKGEYEEHLDEYVKEIEEDWSKHSTDIIGEKPLTYYLGLQQQDEETDRVATFVSPLKYSNDQKKKAEEEAKKKAEAEAAAAAAAAQQKAARRQNNQPPTESSNLPLKATCNDGTTSYQDDPSGTTYRGMCSHHGGIAVKHGRVP